MRRLSARNERILLDKPDLGVDGLLGLFLALVIDDFLLLKEVPAIGVDGNDQGAKLFDLVAPQGFGHAQLVPVVFFDFQHLGSGDYGAAGGEYAVDGAELLTGPLSVGTHAALAHDDPDTGLLDEIIFKLFHPHGGGGANGDHFVVILSALDFPDDGSGVENGLAADVIGQFPAIFNQAAVGHNSPCAGFFYASLLQDHPDLVGIPIDPPIEQRVGLLWRRQKYTPSCIEAFISFVKDYPLFPEEP